MSEIGRIKGESSDNSWCSECNLLGVWSALHGDKC